MEDQEEYLERFRCSVDLIGAQGTSEIHPDQPGNVKYYIICKYICIYL